MTAHDRTEAERAVARALAAATAAVAAVTELGRADQRAALRQATSLAEHLRTVYDAAARLRTSLAGQIHEADALSLAALAKVGGFSKARADQLIRAYRATKEGTS